MKNYYVLSNGRVKREQNTLFIEDTAGAKKPIPVEDVDSLFLFGEIDLNTKLLNFLSQKKIPLHVFNYYGFYAGSYYPREYLHSGYLLVQQVGHYSDPVLRLAIARETVRAAAHSILRNVSYYSRRRGNETQEPAGEIGSEPIQPAPEGPSATAIPIDADLEADIDDAVAVELLVEESDEALLGDEQVITDGEVHPAPGSLAQIQVTIAALAAQIDAQETVEALMGIEGKMRERYYQAWNAILNTDWSFDRRVRRPPDNEINALISFGNSVLYTVCVSEIYRTQLTPTISYLHEPGARRFSLALDLSELFKPLIVDRAIFRLVNTRQLQTSHFDKSLNGCLLTDAGKRLFLGALEERLASTIKHRRLGRHVSYRHLIRLECYKLVRHLTAVEGYKAFRAWW